MSSGLQPHKGTGAYENLNPFELAFIGLVLFDCRDQQLVDEYLGENDELDKLYEDMLLYHGKGMECYLYHGFAPAEPDGEPEFTAWLALRTPAEGYIAYLKPDDCKAEHVYSKEQAWEKMSLWASMGPWDLLIPTEETDDE